jgi:hypothetical protein
MPIVAGTQEFAVISPDKDRFLAEENPFEAMMSRFDYAAQRLNLDPGHYKVLRSPEKQIITSVPVQKDNGEVEVFTGIRVIHNSSRGPAKGGIRFDLNVTLDEVKALAASSVIPPSCRCPSSSASPVATPPPSSKSSVPIRTSPRPT